MRTHTNGTWDVLQSPNLSVHCFALSLIGGAMRPYRALRVKHGSASCTMSVPYQHRASTHERVSNQHGNMSARMLFGYSRRLLIGPTYQSSGLLLMPVHWKASEENILKNNECMPNAEVSCLSKSARLTLENDQIQ